ncbi:DUF58 domain-containing protein [bacterium]|nr:DUF58 domain-containing protein [bacterium]
MPTAIRKASDFGEGQRSGRIGDFLGVREYRHSDCMRQVNWVATARYGDLIVTERRQPQCSGMLIIVDARNRHSTREQLDDQIRVAASLLENLHQSAVPLRLQVGKQYLQVRRGWEGFVQMMDLLADIPADGFNDSSPRLASLETVSIKISSNADGNVLTDISDPTVNQRSMNSDKQRVIYRNHGLANQLLSFWAEVRDANVVA